MKKFAILVILMAFSFSGMANNDNGEKDEPGDPKKKTDTTAYEVSVSKSYFSFFNLFSISPVKSDTLLNKELTDTIKMYDIK